MNITNPRGEIVEGMIAWEDPDELFHCVICMQPDCFEWSNVLLMDGHWTFHVSECRMKLSDFGAGLRKG